MLHREENTYKMVEIIICKLRQLSPAYVRKVMLYTISLLNIQEEHKT